MILKELYEEILVEDVWESIEKLFDYEKYITKEKYFEFYERAKKVEPLDKKIDMVLSINKLKDESLLPEDKEDPEYKEGYLYDVCGFENNIHYAIEFSSWKFWMALNVDSLLEEYSKADILALASWEMTYLGWTEEKIEEANKTLQDRISSDKKEVKELLDLEELLKELDNKKGSLYD